MQLTAREFMALARQVPFQLTGCQYIADFVAILPDRSIRVIDAKGVRTQTYRLKKRMMKEIHGIEIEEV